jgi:hypothetical protein
MIMTFFQNLKLHAQFPERPPLTSSAGLIIHELPPQPEAILQLDDSM